MYTKGMLLAYKMYGKKIHGRGLKHYYLRPHPRMFLVKRRKGGLGSKSTKEKNLGASK